MAANKFVDLKTTPKEAKEMNPSPTFQSAPAYPYGLCLSLCEDELEKLGLADCNLEPGDILHMHAFTLVTSVSESATVDGDPHCRVELQVTHACFEDEGAENEESETVSPMDKLYPKKK